jgi:hypothetical protein
MLRDQLVSHSGTCRRRFVRADYDAGDQCQVRRIIRFPVTFFPQCRTCAVVAGGGREIVYYRTLPPLKSS